MDWYAAQSVKEEHRHLPIRQVYVWYVTNDKKFLLVSKDGKNWQLPGGKPLADESLDRTAIREMQEETGVAIEKIACNLKFFGYYLVIKQEDNGSTTSFLQIRFYLRVDVNSNSLKLSTDNEDKGQVIENQIMHVRAVTVKEAKAMIPWLSASGEFMELEAQGLI